jgi:hypothetical protein
MKTEIPAFINSSMIAVKGPERTIDIKKAGVVKEVVRRARATALPDHVRI